MSDMKQVFPANAEAAIAVALASKTAGRQEAGEDPRTLTRSGSKSGYAKDKFPDRIEGDEKSGGATPIADTTGIQQGRLPPALRKGATHYEAVSAAEADRRRIERMRGNREKIAGGIDDPVPKQPVKDAPPRITGEEQYNDDRMDMGASPDRPEAVVKDTLLAARVPERVVKESRLPTTKSQTIVPEAAASRMFNFVDVSASSKLDEYLHKRIRIQFVVDGGTYSVPAIDVKVSAMCVTILLPCGANDATFIPKPGARLTICSGERKWSCYFPGTACELAELGLTVLILIIDDEKGSADTANG